MNRLQSIAFMAFIVVYTVVNYQRAWATSCAEMFSDSSGPKRNLDLTLDAAFVRSIEFRVHEVDLDQIYRRGYTANRAEYERMVDHFLKVEAQYLHPEILRIAESIRREGKIPLYRTVVGAWIDLNQMKSENNNIIRGQAQLGTSTSLALTTSVEVALAKLKQFVGTPNVETVIIAWEHPITKVGPDPLEVPIAIQSLDVRAKFKVNPKYIDFFKQNIEPLVGIGQRSLIWPILIQRAGLLFDGL